MFKDISRYMKIKKLSSSGRPGLVPAVGRSSYPNRSRKGARDGTGDFVSASRGGLATR